MSFFKKIFATSTKKSDKSIKKEAVKLPLDESFVHNFTKKKGKFLYCTHQEEVNRFLKNILAENLWEDILCFDSDLGKMLLMANANATKKQQTNQPFFTTCEHLIAKDGSILFSSKQLSEKKLQDLPNHFIVFAKTSQIVHNSDQALTSIKNKYKKELPSNISATKCYEPDKVSEDFMDYGNNNSKNLYLILLEDL